MNQHRHYNFQRVGILGGGQLGRMLLQEALNLDIKIAVLDPAADAPCSRIAPEFVQGDFNDYQTVYNFGRNCDIITVEIEHVNVEALEQLEQEGKRVYPQPSVLKIIQDKGVQKEFYKKHNIPTAEFLLLSDLAELKDSTHFLPAVQKLRKGGYDGRGVQVLHSTADLDKGFSEPSVLEKLVDLEKEIAVIVARNASGEMRSFPAVELEFNPEANLVEYLFSPADISPQQEAEAAEIAEKVATALDITGLLAVELFLNKSGQILVNEVAPRPHNSGHHTIEANVVSQFAQHLRAILDLPLGDTATTKPAAMLNLLGAEGYKGQVVYENIEEVLKITGVYPHIYGKTQTKPYRKMGHITITGNSMSEVREKVEAVKGKVKVKSEN